MAKPSSFNNAYAAGSQFASPYETFRAGNLQKIYYKQVRDLRVGKIGLFFYKKNDPIYAEITEFNKSGITFTSLKSRTDDPPIVHKVSTLTRQGEWEFMEEADIPIPDGYRPIRIDDVGKEVLLMYRNDSRSATFVSRSATFVEYNDLRKMYTFEYDRDGIIQKEFPAGYRKYEWEAFIEITYPQPLTLTPFDPSFGLALRSGAAGGGAPNANSRKSKKSRKQRKNRRNRRKTRHV